MESKNKKIFVEALLLTIVVFMVGMMSGIVFEEKRVHVIEEYYAQSQTSLMDIFALNNFAGLEGTSCDGLIASNLEFADRVYYEAATLEKYENAGRLSDDMELEHRKYDIMRTFLWINTIKTDEICAGEGIHTVVYLYEYNSDDLTMRAMNNVWSKILLDVKDKHAEDVLLIPIAADSDMVSLNAILKDFDVSSYPALIIDNKHVLTEVTSAQDIETYF